MTSEWKKSSTETMDKAEAVFHMLMALADGPSEAAEIITAIHTNLWLVGHADGSNIDAMLKGYCDCIKLNVEQRGSTRQ